jgi:uncharacterized membrane protein
MSHKKKISSFAMAATAAALFTTMPITAVHAEAAKVHCFGVNSCKGHNDCKTAKNSCKGMGSCKGQGFVAMSKKECKAKHGSIGKPKK